MLRPFQKIRQCPFRYKLISFYGKELLAPRPTSELQYHLLSARHDGLVYWWLPFTILNVLMNHAVVTWTHLHTGRAKCKIRNSCNCSSQTWCCGRLCMSSCVLQCLSSSRREVGAVAVFWMRRAIGGSPVSCSTWLEHFLPEVSSTTWFYMYPVLP
jgi:hypothetical protein